MTRTGIPIFKGVDYRPTYNIKNKDKFIGKRKSIRYEHPREVELMTFFDNNNNVVFWDFKAIGIKYFDKSSGKNEIFYPTFHVISKVDLLNDKAENDVLLDAKNHEYLVDINPLFKQDYELIEEERLIYMNKSERIRYEDILSLLSNEFAKYEETYNYCHRQQMKFVVDDGQQSIEFFEFYNKNKIN